MTTPQDSNKTTAAVADKAAPAVQKEVSAKQETGGASSTKTAAQKPASTRAKPTPKTATTSARRSTAAKPVKQSSQGSSSKDTPVESKHIADQIKVFSRRRVWPD